MINSLIQLGARSIFMILESNASYTRVSLHDHRKPAGGSLPAPTRSPKTPYAPFVPRQEMCCQPGNKAAAAGSRPPDGEGHLAEQRVNLLRALTAAKVTLTFFRFAQAVGEHAYLVPACALGLVEG
jgi:hypothetical protein